MLPKCLSHFKAILKWGPGLSRYSIMILHDYRDGVFLKYIDPVLTFIIALPTACNLSIVPRKCVYTLKQAPEYSDRPHMCINSSPPPPPPPEQMRVILADDIFKCIFLKENDRIPLQISLRFVPGSPIDNKAALVQVMAWCQTGDKPLPEPRLTQVTDAYMPN